jgi:UDP-glucose 4-epimerase
LGYSVLEVVAAVTAVTGRSVAVIPRPRRVGDPAHLVAAGNRAREVLGWLPKHPDLGTMIADAWAFRGG